EGILELFIARPSREFTANRGPRSSRDRGNTGVSGQVARGGEGAEVSCGEQDGGGGLDTDSWHGNQDLGKRVRIDHFLYLGSDQGTLGLELLDLSRHPRDDQLHGGSTRNHDRLLC